MPELPEVETFARNLREGREFPTVLGHTILAARIYWERTIASPSPEEFALRIAGQQILSVGRRGKFLLLGLSTDTLLIHLRMSGDLFVEPTGGPAHPSHNPSYDRIVLELDGGLNLSFQDTRKFGRIWLVHDPQEILSSLGPEPLDAILTEEEFHQRLVSRRRQLKPLLLDQTFLAGLGNIYADEALHLAKLHPLAASDRLTPQQSARLLSAIRLVLTEGIDRQGASIDWVYRGGDFQNYFRAYRRTDQPCPTCGAPIRRILVGQRSTHFCPNCQKLEG